jgi:hypothetical protein
VQFYCDLVRRGSIASATPRRRGEVAEDDRFAPGHALDDALLPAGEEGGMAAQRG